MKATMCIMLILCFCLVGFTVGRRSVDIYLNDDEAVYIGRYGNKAYVWLYTYNPDIPKWDMKSIKELEIGLPRINVHFVEPLVW